ncbi:phenylacetate--CoA ligase [Shewanella psychropiezotolerans]|uniref:Phenylacetate-coenzyme A ligase n=1 Tax=Shewanella psychropiezotolerans TaxID=2593655 RepID=A0ABX5WZZ7_9GAMM|nr:MULTISPECIES: phenylacetate--CoA ligase PaaK [Shewanella]MPY22359.1 phenylacetate--CoA ligase [Shewanella sp. YLB-07]QDO83308.1 phenylacetate--CoA ligase [Shewanella psychropiezotolerans]
MGNDRAGLDEIETASIDELQALQLNRLKKTLNHAYTNSSVYKEKFDLHGVHPDDLKTLSDLSKFPFTTKKDLRENYPFGIFASPMNDIVRLHASSGTTGKPTVVAYTQNDINNWAHLGARSIYAAGGRRKDKVHISYGYGLFTGGLGAHYAAERLGCTVIPMGGGQTQKQVQLITDFDPDIIMVTPSYMLNIADEIKRQNIDTKELALRIGIFGAEPWSNMMRNDIESRMSMDAVDIYGLSEMMGPGVAQECIETKDGLTIWEDHFYPEIIDPITGEVLPDGSEGELVFTSLSKEAMPMIRYRTRDLTRLLPGSARTMRRMDKITGRSDDMLIIRGVNVFPTQIEEQIIRTDGLSPHYLIEVSKRGNMDTINIRVEVDANNDKQDHDILINKLTHNIKTFIGISASINIEAPFKLPRSQGKATRVIDNRL